MTRDPAHPTTKRFESAWWSVEVPLGWTYVADETCATVHANPPAGVLQISCVKKDSGFVTDEDLLEFVNDRLAVLKMALQPKDVVLGENTGMFISYTAENANWREWWLRLNDLIMYATYNADVGINGYIRLSEENAIDAILCSLKPKQVSSARL